MVMYMPQTSVIPAAQLSIALRFERRAGLTKASQSSVRTAESRTGNSCQGGW